MARSPSGRAALVGPQAFDGDGSFVARRPFRLNGRIVGRGEEVTIAEAGSVQGMRRLVQSRHVASVAPGLPPPDELAVPQPHPDAGLPPEEGVPEGQMAYTLHPAYLPLDAAEEGQEPPAGDTGTGEPAEGVTASQEAPAAEPALPAEPTPRKKAEAKAVAPPRRRERAPRGSKIATPSNDVQPAS